MKNKNNSLFHWTAIAICLLPLVPVETNDFGPKNNSGYSTETASENAKATMTPVFSASTDASKIAPGQQQTPTAFKLSMPAHFMRNKPAFKNVPEKSAAYSTAPFHSYSLARGLSERMVPIFKPGSGQHFAVRLQPATRVHAIANPEQLARYAATKTPALIAQPPQKDESFEEMQVVSNEDLSNIRGGFITSSGMVLDLGLATETIVNGITVQSTTLSPEALKNVDPSTLRTLVRVTEGGANAEKLNLDNVPEIVNVIQNEASNVKIDQITSLNIDVQNVQQFKLQLQTPGLDYGTVINMR